MVAKAANMGKGQWYKGDPNKAANSLHSVLEIAEHKWRRRIWDKGFTQAALKQYEPRVLHHLSSLVAQLRKKSGGLLYVQSKTSLQETGVIDFSDWCDMFTYDMMSDLGFGQESGMTDRGWWIILCYPFHT